MALVSPRLEHFFSELKRRHVVQVAVTYIAVGFVVLQAAELMFPAFELPRWAFQTLVVFAVLGFPIALVLAWAFELKPEDPGRAVVAGSHPVSASAQHHATIPDATGARRSIVVLPFDNMSPDPGDAYFSDGLTEEIITHLSSLHSLRVISRSSAIALKGTGKDVRTIGRELDVQYVLEGSVRKAGDDLRITAQLIDAASDEHLWAERYDGTLSDVFQIQEQASRAIVAALNLKLNPREQEKLRERPVDNVHTWACYLRARDRILKGGTDALQGALRDLEVGMEMLGESELLYRGMAEAHLQTYEYGVKVTEETLKEAETFAKRVMSLRPDSATSHYLKGRLERFTGSVTKATVHLHQALAIDPNHTDALLFLVSAYALQVGRASAVESHARRLVEIDPLSPLTLLIVGWHHWMSGRLDEALSMFARTLRLAPQYAWATLSSGYVLLWQGRVEQALEILDPVIQRESPDFFAEWALLLKHAAARDSASAAAVLSDEVKSYFWKDPEFPWFVASAYALAGARDESLTWLEHGVARGWINFPLFSHDDPFLDSIRDEPRFRDLLALVKARWEEFHAN